MVLFFAFREDYAVKLEFSCASSITHFEELKQLQVLNILLSQYDPKGGIFESIGIFPIVSHPSLDENICDVQDEKYVATGTMNWSCTIGSFAREWFQTGIIYSGVIVPYYFVIADVLEFFEKYLRHLTTVRCFVV